MTPKDRVEPASRALWRDDTASKWLGISLDATYERSACISLTVKPQHHNGYGICDGGVIFSLADRAFASNRRKQSILAQHNMISFISAGRLGKQLTATACELSLLGRIGIYDMQVHNQNDETIAEPRGLSRTISGQMFEENTQEENPK
jgi:acyl-CoA thioesterase